MKINPLYAIPICFGFSDTPGASTFYDFLSRIWNSGYLNQSSPLHPAKEKRIQSPSHKDTKVEPLEKVHVDQLLEQLQTTSFVLDDQSSSMFKIYHQEFLSQCITKGLISPKNLSVAGDRTPVVTSARERKHPLCVRSVKESWII